MVTDYQEIHTERLLMRRWCDPDRAPFAAMNADPEVMCYFPAVLDRAESDQLIDRIEDGFDRQGFGLWALEILESGEFIGFTGLNPMPDGVPGSGDQEVGWGLDQRVWHKGYAAEAARAALDVGLNRLGLPVIWLMTAVINQPSQAVVQRLGMRRHELFDHPRIEMGHALRPHVVYRIGRGRILTAQSRLPNANRVQWDLSRGAGSTILAHRSDRTTVTTGRDRLSRGAAFEGLVVGQRLAIQVLCSRDRWINVSSQPWPSAARSSPRSPRGR